MMMTPMVMMMREDISIKDTVILMKVSSPTFYQLGMSKLTIYLLFDIDSDNQFTINLFGFDLCLQQNPSSKLLGHGAVVWDAAVVFVKYIENNPSLFTRSALLDKSVLELGCGCGLSGLAMMLKGARVTMTDLQCVVESLTTTNTEVILILSYNTTYYQYHIPNKLFIKYRKYTIKSSQVVI